tara:strand:- start:111 stop:380 length:270 start_codon:yes stop_codon:yes gene_type:complete
MLFRTVLAFKHISFQPGQIGNIIREIWMALQNWAQPLEGSLDLSFCVKTNFDIVKLAPVPIGPSSFLTPSFLSDRMVDRYIIIHKCSFR